MDHAISGSVATRPSGRTSGKPGAATRPGPGRPPIARTGQSRPAQRLSLVPGTTRPAPCATPLTEPRPTSAAARNRPWAFAAERLAVAPQTHASIEVAVLAFLRGRTPSAAAPRRRRGFVGTRVAEFVLAGTVGVLAVLVALVAVATLLPGAAGAGAVGLVFLAATGGLAGYASWRWVRWMRDRAERLHWSVIAAAGAATTAAELYAAAAIVASHSGFLERIAAFGGLGFVAALTIAITGAATLTSYHRSVTDAQLIHSARRFA
ncbi:hypothetical protein [Cryptosporangium arvum]|uniref:Uncharacterized protein n=1 Tax=Cryptosporangium arvum DSM 44712 TaxID=927661 RepID=A0A010Z1Y8_9ACTN|nr:hypothetical protein [Cryptosporangium arvum]EXG81443.1 hypothetical protein CryarDRAFT_2557 [Cryptosporangium arvum DSM 44712]